MLKLDCGGVSSLIYSSTGIAKPPCCSTISIICQLRKREIENSYRFVMFAQI